MRSLPPRWPFTEGGSWAVSASAEFGALVGSVLVSVIYTTYINGENPKHYLIALQHYPQQVRSNPELWLPWNYRDALKELEKPPPEIKKIPKGSFDFSPIRSDLSGHGIAIP